MSEDTPPAPESGSRVGDFLVLHPLRSPVPGDVCLRMFLCLDLGQLTEVGLLVRHGDAADRGPFDEDLAAMRRVSHKALPILAGAGVHGERFFNAANWIPGITLRDLLSDGPLPPEVSVRILWELADALAALHQVGLVHGDVHPRNVILSTEGGVHLVGWVPRPFALPLPTHPPDQELDRYSAPEWNREGRLDPAGDVYALGVMAYEMLVGRSLFPPTSVRGLLEAQESEPERARRGLDETCGALAPDLPDLVASMLAADPGARPTADAAVLEPLWRAVPAWTSERSPRAVLGGRWVDAVARHRRALIQRARRALEEDDALIAASCLKRAADLSADTDERVREEAAELLTHCLWDSLRITDPREYGHLAAAMALQLLRAAEGLESRTLTRAARIRLGQLAQGNEVFRPYAPRPAPEDEQAKERRRLIQWVSKRPWDDLALVLLAVLTPDFEPEAAESVAHMQAKLLQHHALHSAALFHRAKDLLDTEKGLPLLRDLQGLLTDALEVERGTPRPAAGTPDREPRAREPGPLSPPTTQPPPRSGMDESDSFFEDD